MFIAEALERAMREGGKRTKVVLGTVTIEGGEQTEGVIKLFKDLQPAAKEGRILRLFEQERPDLPMARVLEYQEVSGGEFAKGGWKYLVAETVVRGPQIADETRPAFVGNVQSNAAILFEQLAFVSGNKTLEAEGVGYCGDLSSLNVRRTREGYVIVDWGGQYDGRTARVTPRYIPPEVMGGNRPMEVNADTYALGCLLARALLGRTAFRKCFLDGGRRTYLRYETIEELVPAETREFFKVALAEDPYDRVVQDVSDPVENYRQLRNLFGS